MTGDVVFRNACLASGASVDITLRDGAIHALDPVAAAGRPPETDTEDGAIDLGGALVLPGLIDGHLHLDKTLLGLDWFPHDGGTTVQDRVRAEKELRRHARVPIADCAGALLGAVLRRGTTTLRSHVDIDDFVGLDNLEALLAVREAWSDRVAIEIVAFPQSGIVTCPGAAELLDAALAGGADLIGGLDPLGFDGDLAGHLDVVFGLAEKHGKGIDIHLHDGGAAGLRSLDDIAARTRAGGLGGRVTVSHAYALGGTGDGDEADLRRTIERLAAARVAILTSVPGASGFPSLAALREAGVTLFLGSDNVRDTWSPYATLGMLERCFLAAYRSGFRSDAEIAGTLDLVTANPAAVLGLAPTVIEAGAAADLIVLDARNPAEAVVDHNPPRLVFKRGRLVAGDP